MPIGQGARNTIILGGLGRPQLFDTNIKATSIDADIFTDHEVLSSTDDADLILVLDTSEDPDKIKYITRADITGGFPVLTGSTNNTVVTVTGSEAIAGEANLLFDGTILTNDGGEVNIDISSGDPHLSFQIGGTDEFTIGVDDDDSDNLKIDTGGTVGGATKLTLDTSGNMTLAGSLTVTGNLLPAADDTHDIGSASAAFQDLFLEGDITLTDAGTIATSAGDLTVDAEGDIILDANGANVTFKDDGTSILDIANSSTDVEISVSTADKNLKFKGTDGSSAITALDIDMALAGKATFNGDVVVGGDLTITGDDLFMNTNTAGHILVGDDTNYNPVAISGDVTLASSGAVTIANTAVESGMLNNNIISGLTEISSGLADADELLYSDAGTIKRVGLDTLSTKILTGNATTATDATNSSHVLVTDNESTDEDNLITFVENGTSSTGNVGLEMDGTLTYNPSTGIVTATGFAGALTGNVTGNASGTAATVTGAAQSNITSLGTLTTLTVDNVITNGTTIGHTDDTDLLTLADGILTVAGEVSMTTLDLGGTNVTSNAAELNLLDGVSGLVQADFTKLAAVDSTSGELNLLDGSAKSTASITIADADAFIVIDGTTTKQIPASDIKTYASGSSATKGFATAMAIAL